MELRLRIILGSTMDVEGVHACVAEEAVLAVAETLDDRVTTAS